MKTALIVLSVICIILLLLLYFGNRSNEVKLKQQRQLYEDSLKSFANTQAVLEMERIVAINERDKEIVRTNITAENYRKQNVELRAELKRTRSPRVETLIEAEPELRKHILIYDSLLNMAGLRIDSMLIEKRIQKELCDRVIQKTDSLLLSEQAENAYLKGEVDKRDETIDKLEKKLKRRTWLGVLAGLLNLIPR